MVPLFTLMFGIGILVQNHVVLVDNSTHSCNVLMHHVLFKGPILDVLLLESTSTNLA